MKNKPTLLELCRSLTIGFRSDRFKDLKCTFVKISSAKSILFVVFLTVSSLHLFAGTTPLKVATGGTPLLSKLYTNLYVVLNDGSLSLSDGTASTYYPSYHNAVDGQDAPKLSTFNTSEELCIVRDGVQLAIERRQSIVDYDTTYLQVMQMGQRQYQLQFIAQNFDPSIAAFLKDDYTGSLVPINLQLTDTTKYNFTVSASSAVSREPNRFTIVYRPAGNLPVNFTGINAYELNRSVNIEFGVANETNVDQYTIERSGDGTSFSKIGVLYPSENTSVSKQYTWIDLSPINSNNFYRIQYQSKSGGNAFSKVVKIKIGNSLSTVKVYPTVIDNGNVQMQFTNMTKGLYNISLINTSGQIVFTGSVSHAGGSATRNILLDNIKGTGIYQMAVHGPDNYFSSVKLLSR